MLGKIKGAAKAVASVAGGTLGAGFEMLKAPLEELSAASPELERIGYRVREIELVCALLPRIVVHLSREATVHDEPFQHGGSVRRFPGHKKRPCWLNLWNCVIRNLVHEINPFCKSVFRAPQFLRSRTGTSWSGLRYRRRIGFAKEIPAGDLRCHKSCFVDFRVWRTIMWASLL
jgi:hypothetical protein